MSLSLFSCFGAGILTLFPTCPSLYTDSHQLSFWYYLPLKCFSTCSPRRQTQVAQQNLGVSKSPRHLDMHVKPFPNHSHLFGSPVFYYTLGMIFISISRNSVSRGGGHVVLKNSWETIGKLERSPAISFWSCLKGMHMGYVVSKQALNMRQKQFAKKGVFLGRRDILRRVCLPFLDSLDTFHLRRSY